MADLRIGSTRYFERGIEGIAENIDAPILPDAFGLAPASASHPSELEQLLGFAGLDSMLDEWVKPWQFDRQRLAWQKLRTAIETAISAFEAAGQDAGARVLAEELELHNLMLMYRRSLVQG